ncbi:MAG TPA: ketoacyl-ACP synthase III [Planctomycetaceae bacterium]|nr:ketoacyl-ACP synthase III [Planctomycetaceae bacterium]
MQAILKAIEYYLPPRVLDNPALCEVAPNWSPQKIQSKTGINERRVSEEDELSSDLAFKAVTQLFESGACQPADIDFLMLCTQSPDYFLPTTACPLQNRLGLRTNCGAFDFNLGCSGFIYGLGLAKGLIETGQAQTVLLVTAETYTKFITPTDMSVRTLFGDAAAATLVQAADLVGDQTPAIGPFVYGTDGRGAKNLIVKTGGMRSPVAGFASGGGDEDADEHPLVPPTLYMNGPEIFLFTLEAVPDLVQAVLDQTGLTFNDFDLFVFHQANEYMLRHLRDKIQIPPDRFFVSMSHCGNTVSSTIPIALKEAHNAGRLKPGDRLMLVGFGVGYSWGATVMRWSI